ncbi:MAG: hypothetical protein KC613_13205, partial [Myxococcales bacterium]|nr:hypothetical protein [Myxococcales bacterium]
MTAQDLKTQEALALLGAPTGDDAPDPAAVARWTGAALPAETHAFLAARPALDQTDGHPEIVGLDFALGLPDVDAWLANLAKGLLGRFAATVHFGGLVPAASRLWYGDFTWLLLPLTEYAPGVAGTLYYDERELGHWGPTLRAWVQGELVRFFEAVDGAREGLDPEDRAGYRPDPDDLRDCFWLPGADTTAPPPDLALPEALEAPWAARAQHLMQTTARRWWLAEFVAGDVDRITLKDLPTPAEWDAAAALGPSTAYSEAMYWLLAHAALGNGPELAAAVAALADHPGEFVQALRAAAPTLVDRFAEPRA